MSKRVVMECIQVRLALQLHSTAQGCHWAAPKPFCHAAQVAAQLQHLLHFAHLHLIVGFCPAAQQGKGEGDLQTCDALFLGMHGSQLHVTLPPYMACAVMKLSVAHIVMFDAIIPENI